MKINKELMRYMQRHEKAKKELSIMNYKREEGIPLSFKEEVNYHEINGYVSGIQALREMYENREMDKEQFLKRLPTLKKRLDFLENLDMGNMGMTPQEVKQGNTSLYETFKKTYEANKDFFQEEKIEMYLNGKNKTYSLHPKISSYFANTLMGNILKWTNSKGYVEINFQEKGKDFNLTLNNSTRKTPRKNIHGEGKGIGTDFINYFLNALNGSWETNSIKNATEKTPGEYQTKISIPLEEITLE